MAFETEHFAALARLSSLNSLVVLGERVVFGLALAHGLFHLCYLILGGQTILLPRLTAAFSDTSKLHKLVVHLMQFFGKLNSIFSHAFVGARHGFVCAAEGALAVVGSAHDFLSGASKFPDAIGVVFFEAGSLLEEQCEFLENYKLAMRMAANAKMVRTGIIAHLCGSYALFKAV